MNECHRDQGPTYGEQVRAALAEKGLRQKDLAACLLLSPQYLNDVVHGRRIPRAAIAARIAEITGVRLETPREKVLGAILRDVAALSPWAYALDGRYCFFCGQSEWERDEHKPSCAWLRAARA